MNPLKLGLTGFGVFVLGVFMVIYRDVLVSLGIPIVGVLLIGMGLLSYFKHHNLKLAIAEWIMGVINLLFPNGPIFIIVLMVSMTFFLHAFVHLVTAILDYRNASQDFLMEFFLTIYYLGFGLVILMNPLKNATGLLFLMGIYLCLYGLADMKEALFEYYNINLISKFRHKVRVQLPALLSVLIPTQVLVAINKLCEDKEESVISEVKQPADVDLEVLIHMTPSGYSALGHVDLCINDYVITYGNYDASTYRLFDAIGDGVLMVVPKEKYIPFCKKDTGKTLIGFGLTLTSEQKKAVRQRIRTIFDLLYPWECNYKKAERHHQYEVMEKSLKYYANRIYKDTKAKMYKFKKSKFKTYFVFTTNCVLLADSILGKAGVDLLGINGVITPGTYYDYLNRQFTKEYSHVISRTVYL